VIYLDCNATTPVHPAVRHIVGTYLGAEYGNPSSAHGLGRAAKLAVDRAREQVATAIGAADAHEIVFTGSATEANNLALFGWAARAPHRRKHLLVSAVEHPAVMEPALELHRLGWQLSVAPVLTDGRLDLDAFERILAQGDVSLVSVMLANNELGTVQPVARASKLARECGALMHVDAAQAMGKIDVDVRALGADLLTIAGHKMYAPKGIGALYVRRGVPLQPTMLGALQEAGLRPGTENVAYIAGLGEASRLVSASEPARVRMALLRNRLQALLLGAVEGLTVNGSTEFRLPNTLHVSFPGASGQALVAALALDVALSAGAACHSEGSAPVSGPLRAIGATAERARGALRLSLGWDTTPSEIDEAARRLRWSCRA
jgi:cysteine desulfurase